MNKRLSCISGEGKQPSKGISAGALKHDGTVATVLRTTVGVGVAALVPLVIVVSGTYSVIRGLQRTSTPASFPQKKRSLN